MASRAILVMRHFRLAYFVLALILHQARVLLAQDARQYTKEEENEACLNWLNDKSVGPKFWMEASGGASTLQVPTRALIPATENIVHYGMLLGSPDLEKKSLALFALSRLLEDPEAGPGPFASLSFSMRLDENWSHGIRGAATSFELQSVPKHRLFFGSLLLLGLSNQGAASLLFGSNRPLNALDFVLLETQNETTSALAVVYFLEYHSTDPLQFFVRVGGFTSTFFSVGFRWPVGEKIRIVVEGGVQSQDFSVRHHDGASRQRAAFISMGSQIPIQE